MPKYHYKCKHCHAEIEVWHMMSEVLTKCESCEKDHVLEKIPSIAFTARTDLKQKPGQYIKEYIEDVKKDIEESRKEASKKVYKEE